MLARSASYGLHRVAGVLLGLLALLALGAAATAQLQHTAYGDGTAVAGELLAGHSVGQTFRAQHDGLSAVNLRLATYARVNTGTLVLHLRRDVTGTRDLVTVAVPVRTLADNSWQRFAFPPLAGSGGRQYYVELEDPGAAPGNAVTVYWTLHTGDPYPYGRATADRAPLDGDLAFGLDYDLGPSTLWGDLARTLLDQLPARLGPVLGLALAAAAILLVLLLGGAARGWYGGRPLRRVLLGALLGAFALAHGLVYMISVPPWQGPDEFAHYAYVALLAAGYSAEDASAPPKPGPAALERDILAAMDAHGFTRTVSWYAAPGGPAAGFVDQLGGSSMFWETRQPPLYYRLAVLPLRLYAADPRTIPPDIGLYLVRATSVLWSTLVVLLAWGCALFLAPGPRFRPLWLALPLAVALLPMRAFIDSMANNDVLAEAACTLLALLLFAACGLRRPRLGHAALALVLGAAVFLVALATKTSTVAVPGALLWLGSVAAICARLLARDPAHRYVARVALGAALVLPAVLAVGFLAGADRTGAAQDWQVDQGQPAARTGVSDAHDGAYVVALTPDQGVAQRVMLPPGQAGTALQFRVWARPLPGTGPGRLTVSLVGDFTPITTTTGVLTWTVGSAAPWQPVTATAIIPAGLPSFRCVVRADQPAQIDDAALEVVPGAGGAAAPVLHNPSMEAAALTVRPDSWLGRLLARLPATLQADLIAETLVNPQPFDKVALAGSYLVNEFRSFWGWFGWLGLPLALPDWQYLVWGGLSLLALAGWLGGWVVRPRLWVRRRVLGLFLLLACAATVTVTLGRQMMLLALAGFSDFPQGRYLFVLVVPTAWLLLTGLARLALWRRPRRAGPPLVPWGPWLALTLLLGADLYALFVVILPYYYGRF